MKPLNLKDVTQYVEDNIGTFHQKRIAGLNGLRLKKVLAKKNPYLFKAKYILTAQDIIKNLTDAFISSQEETIFGDWLEGLAIFINSKVYNGRKSGIQGIDLEFDKDNTRYIITIKSGPNWGNSSQIGKMKADFKTAQRTLRTSNSKLNIVAVNGCCYGRDNRPDKGDYFKYCGQHFWEFISGDKELYLKIIEPLGHKAKERNDEFIQSYSQMINVFTKEFADTFCNENGSINWNKLVYFNSSTTR
ncbi:cytosolic protein [Arachidicoccus ginsenosidimutans]|uniref:PmeII family type II restriction endonuclease n=1 Tax=Arachidicoccus sp. BS20 TaxID=1850526 RepID=UPI0007F06FD3|nr:PmeII family type II restriction endonuclease [Arachidicoccus sp. BS20]ANI89558.1 cytosolic protein [Arachidicoccus sp. BS20]